MEWGMLEQLYLALSRIFDGFIHFLNDIFGEDEAE